tara:strand:+ start:503 stop:937 length:435 start_codon:yes stop_codon:yes gene_type:complete
MAGKIIADTIEGTTTTETVGGASVTIPNSIDTKYVVNGSAKAWVHFDAEGAASVSGTPIMRDSLNASTIGDDGNGDYTVNFSSNFANGFYATSGTGDHAQYGFVVDPSIDPTTSAFAMMFSYQPSATSDIDVDNCSTIHMGELA